MPEELITEEILEVIWTHQITDYCNLVRYLSRYEPDLLEVCLEKFGLFNAITVSAQQVFQRGEGLMF